MRFVYRCKVCGGACILQLSTEFDVLAIEWAGVGCRCPGESVLVEQVPPPAPPFVK